MAKLKRIFLSPPHMSGEEMRFIQEAFDSNYIAPLGPQVDAFEQEFTEKVGISHAVALSSGTAAMHLALRVLGVGPGDEVIASTLTFIGSVSPIIFQDATPVLIDSDRTSWTMDPDLLAEELKACHKCGRLPKVVIPTDLYGQCADLGKILEICKPYDIPVVADSAEALGSVYCREQGAESREQGAEGREQRAESREHRAESREQKEAGKLECQEVGKLESKWAHAGAWAKAAVFSFNGNKIITTSGGGMLVSEDESFIERARFLSQQARDPAPHFEHSQIGYNYRMSNVLAAIGRGQIRVLDERVKEKREIFDYYQKTLGDLPGIEFMSEARYGKSNRWLSVILITPEEFGMDRETVRLALEAENIEARPVWKPMHLQPVFRSADYPSTISRTYGAGADYADLKGYKDKKTYPCRVVGGEVAEDLFKRGLCLPSGTAMTDEDLERVNGVIRKCCKTK